MVWTGNYAQPFDFRTQTYQGEPVLTFWSGEIREGYGHGSYHILNQSYAEIAHLSAVGYEELSDLHEFTITPDDTALVIVYTPKQADLSLIGGAEDGWILACIFQEINIASGRLLFEWDSSSHVGVIETVDELGAAGTEASPFDYLHINSVLKDTDGTYLVSARAMSAVYKISGSGDIIWRIGGTRSDFDIADDAVFAFQHDARWADTSQTRISLFDNGPNAAVGYSRGLLLAVDQVAKTVSLVTEFANAAKTIAQFEGNLQALDIGDAPSNYFLGYGIQPFLAEFSSNGTLLLDAQFGAENLLVGQWGAPGVVSAYRAYKLPWIGKPTTIPDVYFDTALHTAYLSWNGATEVDGWEVYVANATSGPWGFAARKVRTGFETVVGIGDARLGTYVRARAVDGDGKALGWTRATDGTGLFDAEGDVDVDEEKKSSSSSSSSSSSAVRTMARASVTATSASASASPDPSPSPNVSLSSSVSTSATGDVDGEKQSSSSLLSSSSAQSSATAASSSAIPGAVSTGGVSEILAMSAVGRVVVAVVVVALS